MDTINPNSAVAHSATDSATGRQRFHALDDHLQAVARLARGLSQSAGPDWGHLAGLWHDLGKFRPGFQRYVRQDSNAHIEGRGPASSDKTHSAAGALHAIQELGQRWGAGGRQAARALAYVIAGHHAGLANWTADECGAGLDTRLLAAASPSQREYEEAMTAAKLERPDLLALPVGFDLPAALAAAPGLRSGQPLACALWIRMLFSALVDADFLDTEAWIDPTRAANRQGGMPLHEYLHRLDTHLSRLLKQLAQQQRGQEPVMQARAAVLQQCRDKAGMPPGVFTLTVPTGGGKTLSSLAFALKHAVAHGQRRVIYAIPYTSIIEQTVDVLAGIFGVDAVLEHHSQADGGDENASHTLRSRLACENWDAPLIVTTNVQLFESLFAARTSRCRKLHRLAGSVIVLDEAQLLPPDFLQPVLDALHVLVAHYGVTLLLCTATQPVLTDSLRFDPRQQLRGLPKPTTIVDDEAALYASLRRTQLHWPADLQTAEPLPDLADRIAAHDCVLTIVNTRRDAADVLQLLRQRCDDLPLHLSAAMCGQHRADVITQIRQRLAARRSGTDARALRVVSTQLVEAGVDIDFPVVFRALAGLDSIAQAAGRCNREGALAAGAMGQVHVFVRDIPKSLTALRLGAQATRSVRAAGTADALSPQTFDSYFRLYHGSFPSLDRHGIVDLLSRDKARFEFQFRTAAHKFKLIDEDDQAGVIVPYRSPGADSTALDLAIKALQNGAADRWLLRRVQRHTVSERLRRLELLQSRGDVVELIPGLYLLVDQHLYDPNLGLLPQDQGLDAAGLVA